jgi:hypothetical protein
MKKTLKLFGIIALVAVIGLLMTACNDDGDEDPCANGHDYKWVVINYDTYPANSKGTCTICSASTTRTTQIGDAGPAGGVIFNVAPNGFTVEGFTGVTGSFSEYTAYYLEAAPDNEKASPSPSIDYWWDRYQVMIPVTTFTSSDDSEALLIGNGRRDT